MVQVARFTCTYEERVKLQKEYDDAAGKIYGYLIGCLGQGPIKRIENHGITPGDGVGAYAILRIEYAHGSNTNRRKLITSLCNLRMTGKNNTLSAYTYEFKRITNILAAHETMLPEEVKVAIYLAGLSPAYQQAKNILNTAPKANASSYSRST